MTSAKQIEQMKPSIHFMEHGNLNQQYIIARSRDEIARVERDFKQSKDLQEDGKLGKRVLLEGDDHIDEEFVKLRAGETKKKYQKFADLLDKQERLEDYYLQVNRDKAQLVVTCNKET